MLSPARSAASVFQQCLLSGLGSTVTLIFSPTRRPTSALSLYISRDSSCLFFFGFPFCFVFGFFSVGIPSFISRSVGSLSLCLCGRVRVDCLFKSHTLVNGFSRPKFVAHPREPHSSGTAAQQPRDAFMRRQVLQIESWIRSASQARSNPVEYSYWEEKRRHSKNSGIEFLFLAQPQDAPVPGTDFQMFYCFIVFLGFPGSGKFELRQFQF